MSRREALTLLPDACAWKRKQGTTALEREPLSDLVFGSRRDFRDDLRLAGDFLPPPHHGERGPCHSGILWAAVRVGREAFQRRRNHCGKCLEGSCVFSVAIFVEVVASCTRQLHQVNDRTMQSE